MHRRYDKNIPNYMQEPFSHIRVSDVGPIEMNEFVRQKDQRHAIGNDRFVLSQKCKMSNSKSHLHPHDFENVRRLFGTGWDGLSVFYICSIFHKCGGGFC